MEGIRKLGRRNSPGTLLSAVSAASVGLAIDAVTFSFASPGQSPTPGFPPSWFIGSVWVLLFALLGVAWSLLQGAGNKRTVARWSVIGLLLFCSAYPFYTGLFTSLRAELIGNVATILLALIVTFFCFRISRRAGVLILPTIVWVLFATILTLNEGRS